MMDEDPEVRRRVFDTPLSVQRYQWVKEYLVSNPRIKSVTDFGCGNGRILHWLKNVPNLELINFVDSDFSLLDHELEYQFRPTFSEMLLGRDSSSKDLNIRVYHANMTIPDERLRADCVIMVEVIEHMHLVDVERASRAIFGYYQPELVIITTPNSEFNHLLQAGPRATKFRHYDHKFEWTRREFLEWAQSVSSNYSYSFQLDGVGHLPPNSEPYGPCTQIAVFQRDNSSSKRLQQTNSSETDKSLLCFDLLLDKLNVKDSVPDWKFDAGQKKVSLLTEYTIPGSSGHISTSASSEPFDWGTSTTVATTTNDT